MPLAWTSDHRRAWAVGTVEVAAPAAGEVVLDVLAAGLNHADLLMLDGAYVPTAPGWTVAPARVGFECAGRVAEVGAGVDAGLVGTVVMTQTGGACAERVTADAAQLLPVPEGLDPVAAAALPSAASTAFDALTARASLARGDRVLVLGATSATGLVAVQLARALGAGAVTGTTRSARHAAAVTDAGADAVLVLDADPRAGRDPGADADADPRAGRDPGGDDDPRAGRDPDADADADLPAFDVVLDLVGGAALSWALGRTAPRGRIVQIGRLGGATATIDLERLARNRVTLTGTTFRGRSRDELRALAAALAASGTLAVLRPPVASTVPFADPAAALARLREPARPGKVVVDLA